MIDYIQIIPISSVITTMVILAYLIVKQTRETIIKRDYLSKYRYRILSFLVVIMLSLIPVFVYILVRLFGDDNELLRNIATYAGRIGPLFMAVALLSIYDFKPKR